YLTFANGSHTVKEWNTGTITRTDGKSWSDSFFSVEGLITLGKPLAGLTFARGAAGDTISRASGDWATDGFIARQLIYVSGTPGNNGVFTIAGVSANHKTLVLTAVNALNPEGPETATISADVGTVSTVTDVKNGSGQVTSSTLTLIDLKPFFLTSANGTFTVVQRNRLGQNTDFFVFPLANQYKYDGNDVIDAHSLFATIPNGQLPAAGFTAYGGKGTHAIHRRTRG